jgi:tetratricopeptide (TPR) repeat protein
LVPEDDFVQKKYAVTLIRTGDLETAQTVLENLFERSKDEKVGLILGGVYTGLDQEKKARQTYQGLLAANSKNEDACIYLSKSYAINKETKKAVDLLRDCAKKDPTNGMYDYYLGKVHLDQGEIKLAEADFRNSLRRQPYLSQSVHALGLILEEQDKFDAALKVYKNHLKKKKSDSAILARLVHILFLREKFDEVIPYAEKLSDLEPDNLNLKVKLGILYTDAKRFHDAVSVFRDLLVLAPESDKILYYLGAIHQELKEWQASIEYFNQIPSSSGLYSDSSVQMANMLSNLAQEDGIKKVRESHWKEVFLKHVDERAKILTDMRVDFAVIKAGFYEAIGDYAGALASIVQVKDEEKFSLQHKYYLANLYDREKKFEESTSLILDIIEKEPKNAHAWNFLGYSMLVRGEKLDLAYSYLQKAKEISPEDGYIRDSLGWYYYKQGDTKKALRELEFAFKKVPDDVEILKHLATIHQELKEYSKAKSYLESALKNARFHYDRKEIQSQIEAIENSRIPASGEID